MRGAARAGLCLALLVLPLPAPADEESGSMVSLRILPLSDPLGRAALWDAIDKITLPTTLDVPAGVAVGDAVRKKCGAAPDDLLKVLQAKNVGMTLAATDAPRELRFIPCPYWSYGEGGKLPTTRVRKGEILEWVLRNAVGVGGPDTVKRVRELNPEMVGPQGEITKSGNLTIPFIIRALRIPVSASMSEDEALAFVAPILRILPANAVALVSTERTVVSERSYSMVGEDSPWYADPQQECGGPESEKYWPFDAARVAKAFADLQSGLKEKPPTPIVLIADTGLDLSQSTATATPALENYLWTNASVVEERDRLPGAPYKGDLHGASMVTRTGHIEPSPKYGQASHGTYVARILLEPAVRAGERAYPRIAIAKLNDESSPYSIQLNAIPDALSYARIIGASVVNLSVVIGAAVTSLADGLRDPSYLVIAAAGNKRSFLDELRIYPPSFDDSYRRTLIVVGAHDWGGHLAEFSNRGSLVDILAPGCAIPVKIGNSIGFVSGTSFAVPFVAYAATLLRALNLSPEQIRTRIIVSADYDAELFDVVRNGSRLNIERAIRLRDDSIILRRGDGVLLFGDLDPMQTWTCRVGSEDRLLNPQQVYKIVPEFRVGSDKYIFKVWKRAAGSPSPAEITCEDGISEQLSFRGEGENTFTTHNWNDVIDVVPALFANPRAAAAPLARR